MSLDVGSIHKPSTRRQGQRGRELRLGCRAGGKPNLAGTIFRRRRRPDLTSAGLFLVAQDAIGSNQDRYSAFVSHDPVVFIEVVVGAACCLEHFAQQEP